jgi:2-oxoacid:acceptor oxidoreductase gamma subunit (pyruvate/2-ketoisovalerate family)
MKEIRLHGRGGQGAVLASQILVSAAVKEGKFGNAIPYFGFERRGAPLVAFVRIDDNRIREHTQIYTPDCVLVLDPTLVAAVNVFQGLKEGGIVIINERKAPEDVALPAQVGRCGVLDATAVALDVLGSPITNTPMLGAFAATTGWIGLDALIEALREILRGKQADLNVQAALAGYERTRVVGR